MPNLFHRTVLFSILIILVAGCSSTHHSNYGGSSFSYEGVILGMPVAPADGWDAFNERTPSPEDAQNLEGEVILNITLDAEGRVAQLDPLLITDDRLGESVLAAVRDTEFLPVDAAVNTDGLQFSLSVVYLHGRRHGAAMGLFDVRETLPSLRSGRATPVAERYLYGPDSSDGVIVETEPEIIGGLAGMQGLVRLPERALRSGTRQTIVFVSFTVNTDGRAERIRVVQSAGGAFDNEAVSAVEQSRYIPGTINGVPVPMEMIVPLRWIVM